MWDNVSVSPGCLRLGLQPKGSNSSQRNSWVECRCVQKLVVWRYCADSSYIVIGSVYPEVWRLKNCKEVRQVRLTKVITIQEWG